MLTTKSIDPNRSAVSAGGLGDVLAALDVGLVVERLNVATLAPCFSASAAMSAPMP